MSARIASLIALVAFAGLALKGACGRTCRPGPVFEPAPPPVTNAELIQSIWPGMTTQDAARLAMAWPVHWPETSRKHFQ